jgi:hypothetical protein
MTGAPGEGAAARGAPLPGKRPNDAAEIAPRESFRDALRRPGRSLVADPDPNGPGAGNGAGLPFELGRGAHARAPVGSRGGGTAQATIDRAASASRAAQTARVLLGTGGGGDVAEARIRIGGEGPAAAEIRLAATRDGRMVEAQLLTAADCSRETLAVMLDEIRMRLRARGVVLRAWSGGRARREPGEGQRPGDDR